MALRLTTDDFLILKKLAPELADTACTHSGHCIKPEHVDVEAAGARFSRVKATELLELYKFAGD